MPHQKLVLEENKRVTRLTMLWPNYTTYRLQHKTEFPTIVWVKEAPPVIPKPFKPKTVYLLYRSTRRRSKWILGRTDI